MTSSILFEINQCQTCLRLLLRKDRKMAVHKITTIGIFFVNNLAILANKKDKTLIIFHEIYSRQGYAERKYIFKNASYNDYIEISIMLKIV